MSSEYVPELVKLIPTLKSLPRSWVYVYVVFPVLLLAVDHIYMFGKVFIDEFISVHVAFSYPGVGFCSIALPLNKVICSPTPWFSGFSSDFAFSAVEDFLNFVLFFSVNEIWWRWRWLFLIWECGGRIWSEE